MAAIVSAYDNWVACTGKELFVSLSVAGLNIMFTGTRFNGDTAVGRLVKCWWRRDPENWKFMPVIRGIADHLQPHPLGFHSTLHRTAHSWLQLGEEILEVS